MLLSRASLRLARTLPLARALLPPQPPPPPARLRRARLSSSSSSSSSSSAPPPPPPPSPGAAGREHLRAVSGPSVGKRGPNAVARVAAGGAALFALYVAYQHDFSLAKLRAAAARALEAAQLALDRARHGAPLDPAEEDLKAALPPPADGYISVLLSVEGVILRRTWDRRYGYRLELREGARELLRDLQPGAPLGVWLTLWSENTQPVAQEEVDKLMADQRDLQFPGPPLSSDHIFAASGRRKEKRLEYFGRELPGGRRFVDEVLLIDCDPVSEELNPDNTLRVEPMRERLSAAAAEEAEAAAAATRSATGAGGASTSAAAATAAAAAAAAATSAAAAAAAAEDKADTTCAAIRALLVRVRQDAMAGGGGGGAPRPNVPATLKRLRAEAVAAGFAPDAGGIFAYLGAAARREEEAEARRRDSGLGGLLRRAMTSAVRARAASRQAPLYTTTEANSLARFELPTYDDSWLARKVARSSEALRRQSDPQAQQQQE